MHLARLPKENGKRGRMVVFTHGAKPTVVIQGELLCLALHLYVAVHDCASFLFCYFLYIVVFTQNV